MSEATKREKKRISKFEKLQGNVRFRLRAVRKPSILAGLFDLHNANASLSHAADLKGRLWAPLAADTDDCHKKQPSPILICA